jgi:hypothetical protein
MRKNKPGGRLTGDLTMSERPPYLVEVLPEVELSGCCFKGWV